MVLYNSTEIGISWLIPNQIVLQFQLSKFNLVIFAQPLLSSCFMFQNLIFHNRYRGLNHRIQAMCAIQSPSLACKRIILTVLSPNTYFAGSFQLSFYPQCSDSTTSHFSISNSKMSYVLQLAISRRLPPDFGTLDHSSFNELHQA